MRRQLDDRRREPVLRQPTPPPDMRSERRVLLDGLGKQAMETGQNRLLIAAALFAVAFLAIAGRLVQVGLWRGVDEPQLAETRLSPALETGRSDIVDRNGVLLATTLGTASLYANPKRLIDPADAAERLSQVLPELDRGWLLSRLTADRSFVWIRRKLTPQQQYRVNRLGIPGLDFQREERRVYPHGRLVAHVLGYTDIDNRGIAGIENGFDHVLRTYREPLALSIDLRIQHLVREELAAAVAEFEALGGCAIVLDVDTGEILALVSLPDFDPGDAAGIDAEARFNRASLGIYEMGSTFKLFTVAMALDLGVVGLDGGYDATHPLRVSRYTITDYHAKARWLTVPEILIYSSNIGAAKMARDVGSARQRAFLERLGMLRPAAVELPEVGKPLVPSPWREINTLTVAYGHGLAVSPLQLAAGVAALVNGGVLHSPTLLRQDKDAVGAGDRVLKPNTSAQMRHLMRLVVERGTGRKAQVPGYLIGGKTGTADKLGGDGRYARNILFSSFVAAFPIDAPRYALLVALDEPKGNARTHGYATGGWVAAPAVARVIERLATLAGIEPIDRELPWHRRGPLVAARAQGG
jgi:cell division protein FtsI (penicillin-binding protein 3)